MTEYYELTNLIFMAEEGEGGVGGRAVVRESPGSAPEPAEEGGGGGAGRGSVLTARLAYTADWALPLHCKSFPGLTPPVVGARKSLTTSRRCWRRAAPSRGRRDGASLTCTLRDLEHEENEQVKKEEGKFTTPSSIAYPADSVSGDRENLLSLHITQSKGRVTLLLF